MARKSGFASLLSAGGRGSLKRLVATGKTREAIKVGLDVLKKDPFDVACILSLAEVCGDAHCLDTQGLFLRRALDVAQRYCSEQAVCQL